MASVLRDVVEFCPKFVPCPELANYLPTRFVFALWIRSRARSVCDCESALVKSGKTLKRCAKSTPGTSRARVTNWLGGELPSVAADAMAADKLLWIVFI